MQEQAAQLVSLLPAPDTECDARAEPPSDACQSRMVALTKYLTQDWGQDTLPNVYTSPPTRQRLEPNGVLQKHR